MQVNVNKKDKFKCGFSFMEIMISLGIIGILAGTIVPLSTKMMSKLNITATQKELQRLEEGLLGYYRSYSKYPSKLELLWTDKEGPFVSGSIQDLSKDAWGEPYLYYQGEKPYEVIIRSKGQNRKIASKPEDPQDDLVHIVSARLILGEQQENTKKASDVLIQAMVGRLIMFDELVKSCDRFYDRLDLSNTLGIQGFFKNNNNLGDTRVVWRELQRKCDCDNQDNEECPAIYSENFLAIPGKDPWGHYFRWDIKKHEFYSTGPR
ncbi:type II secretion system protein GspG [Deltaproteobacteria bacterium TL4]